MTGPGTSLTSAGVARVARALGIMVAGLTAIAAPGAMGAQQPITKLVPCGADDCLLVSGSRADPALDVLVNGHAVDVEGGRAWKARLPVSTVRAWSAPKARAIYVTVVDPDSPRGVTVSADLPIGLLGHTTTLAALVIRSR